MNGAAWNKEEISRLYLNSVQEPVPFSVLNHGYQLYKGCTLGELWEHHRDLFGNLEGDRFPLLTKILDADQDLSVQVHPNDDFAKMHENGELGKTECWYIIDCAKDAEIIFGHNATTKEELISMIKHGEWDGLLNRVKVKPGDFFFVPSGTVHAIGKSTCKSYLNFAASLK